MASLTLTLIQPDLIWENKQANLLMLDQKIAAIKERTQIILLPEMFSTGFTMKPQAFAEDMQGPTVAWMKKVASQKKVILTGSMIAAEESKDPGKEKAFYNRLVWMLPDGSFGFYDKRHLFAYGGEHEHYRAGNRRLIASVNGWRINLQVCYDLRFPVWSRQSTTAGTAAGEGQPEYDLLVYVANWPERRIHAWKILLQARAIENQCYVIGVNRTGNDGNGIYHSGDSMVVDPLGAILYQKSREEDVFTCTLSREVLEEVRTQFPFWKDADSFTIDK